MAKFISVEKPNLSPSRNFSTTVIYGEPRTPYERSELRKKTMTTMVVRPVLRYLCPFECDCVLGSTYLT